MRLEHAGRDQLGERQRQGGLEPEHPRGRLVEAALLGLRAWGAWSVAMASIVPSARPRCTAATSAAVRSGGLTLNTGSNDAHRGVGQGEVVRRDLGRDRQPRGLRVADDAERRRGREVEEVQRRPGEPRAGRCRA